MNTEIDLSNITEFDFQKSSQLPASLEVRHDHPYVSLTRAPFKAKFFKLTAGTKINIDLINGCEFLRISSSDLLIGSFDGIEASLPDTISDFVSYDSLTSGFIVNANNLYNIDGQRVISFYSPLDVYVSLEFWKYNNF
jgi:hypothetical protein